MAEQDREPAKKRKPKGATGLYVSGSQVLATTLGGPRGPIDVTAVEIEDGDVGAAIARLRDEDRLGAKVAVGIDPRWLYVLTTSGAPARDGPSASGVLARHLGDADGLCGGRATLRLGKSVHTRTVGCPRPLAESIYDAVHGDADDPRLRLVPTPDLVLREVSARKRASRRWAFHLRILPGDPDGIALLVHRGQVVAWKLFEFRLDGDPWVLETAVLGLLGHASDDIGITDVGGALLHVGDDPPGSSAHADLAAHLSGVLHVPVEIAPRVEHDAELCSASLARAARTGWRGTDLFEDMHPEGGLRENFPWLSAAGLLVTAGGCFWFLSDESARLEEAVARIDVAVVEAADAAEISLPELVDEHERMVFEARTAYAFLVDRVPWAEALAALPEMISSGTELEMVEGTDDVVYPAGEDGAVRRNTRSLLLQCKVPLGLGEQQSPEPGRIAAALREREPYKRLLSHVGMSEMQTLPNQGGKRQAQITLLVLPGGG